VPSDVALIDRDLDGMVDHAYVADTGGNLYRIDFVDPSVPPTPSSPLPTRAPGAWTITKIAYTNGGSRKFLFAPAVLATTDRAYIAFGSGDRERPLITNYPYTTPVLNRYYMFTDLFPAAAAATNLDGASLDDFTADTTCSTQTSSGKLGWRMDLNTATGEQTVTSSVIFGGAVFFSTNHAVPASPNTCQNNLGEARAYAVNLLNASGIIGSGSTCGGTRSDTFVGGGLPPSPVVGTVQVQTAEGTKTIPVLIGGANLSGGPTLPTGAQTPPVPIAQIRSRIYWYRQGDK
jgi:Tfp pilus tip-associated adhesin PilY1